MEETKTLYVCVEETDTGLLEVTALTLMEWREAEEC